MNDQSPPAFTQDEDAIAQNLGIDRSVVREKRGRRGVDFMRGEHGRYLWTEMAAANLALSLGVSCPEKAAPVLLIVANIALPSPTALACVEKGAPLSDRSEWKIVRVRPACRCLFLVGMEIMVEPLAYSAWKYVGPPEWTPTPNTPARYPRSRGKW